MLNDKGIGEDCKVINEQQEGEDRETFFSRINQRPNDKEYGSNEKLDLKINNSDWEVRTKVAEQGYGLDKLVNDKNNIVRAAVAEQGYGLDKLIDDEGYYVRETVARQGYGLDILINDESFDVRRTVASQGYGLDKLINDGDDFVRVAVAKQGYGLEKLVNDKEWRVRMAVAEQGYGLDKLINDEDGNVRHQCYKYICSHNQVHKYITNILNEKDEDCLDLIIENLKDVNILIKINIQNKASRKDKYRIYFKAIYEKLDEIKGNQEYLDKLQNDIIYTIQTFGFNSQFMVYINKICEKLEWDLNIDVK